MEISSVQQAEQVVVEQILRTSEHDLVILHDKTEQRGFGFIVYYTTRAFAETGNPSTQVPGNGPVAVLRNGSVHPLPTSLPPQRAIARFEQELLVRAQP